MVIQKKKIKKIKIKKNLRSFGDIFRKGVKDSLQNTFLLCACHYITEKLKFSWQLHSREDLNCQRLK